MTTINIHKDKLLSAAFAYQQAVLKECQEEQTKMIDEEMSRHWLIRPKNRHVCQSKFSRESHCWNYFVTLAYRATQEYMAIQTACRVAEDGIVSLDIDVVQRIFGEE